MVATFLVRYRPSADSCPLRSPDRDCFVASLLAMTRRISGSDRQFLSSSPPALGRPALDETTHGPLSRRKPGPNDRLLVRPTSGPRLPPGQRLSCVPAVLFLASGSVVRASGSVTRVRHVGRIQRAHAH